MHTHTYSGLQQSPYSINQAGSVLVEKQTGRKRESQVRIDSYDGSCR